MSNKRARGFAFTLNNYSEADTAALQAADCRYIVFGREAAPTTGTLHLQGYVFFELQKTLRAAVAWFEGVLGHARAHIEMAYASALANKKYCVKDADTFERGECPLTQKEKGDAAKDAARRNLECLAEGRIEDMDADVVATQLRNYEYGARALKRARTKVEPLDGVLDNYWVTGAPGVGKDQYVRATFLRGDHYVKGGTHKWWDHYNDEPVVWVRDLGKKSRDVIDLLKADWSDRYPFTAEVKCGMIGPLRPKTLVVTTNFLPEDLYDAVDAVAIRRRFQVIEITADGRARWFPRENTERPPLAVREDVPPEPEPEADFFNAPRDPLAMTPDYADRFGQWRLP